MLLGSASVQLESNDPSVVARIDLLFDGLMDAEQFRPGEDLICSVDLIGSSPQETRSNDRLYELRINDELVDSAMGLAQIELRLTRLINEHKLESEPHRLHLHSAGLARGSEAVFLLGQSGSGKSTLTAALVERGWRYITDEQITIRQSDLTVIPYPRPLTLRRDVWPLFSHLPSVQVAMPMPHLNRVEIPPSEFAPVSRGGEFSPTMIVTPTYIADAPAGIEPLGDCASAVALLSSCCYDSDRTAESGFQTLVALAQRCPSWQLQYSNFDDASGQIARAFDLAPPDQRVSARHTVADAENHAGQGFTCHAPGVETWSFGDGSSVALNPATMMMASLSEAEARMWELLDQPWPVAELLAELTDESERARLRNWLEVLGQHGLLIEPHLP